MKRHGLFGGGGEKCSIAFYIIERRVNPIERLLKIGIGFCVSNALGVLEIFENFFIMNSISLAISDNPVNQNHKRLSLLVMQSHIKSLLC